jgi:4-deoxy-L-threo-5-hexosulose-uronate ketol-isomerase
MEIRFANSPQETAGMDTATLRQQYAVTQLMQPGKVKLLYTHYDRMVIGGVVPLEKKIGLPNPAALRAAFFLERRELGIINVGGKGTVSVDGKPFALGKMDALYVGKGAKNVFFASASKKQPAQFYLLSAPAHAAYPATICTKQQAMPVQLGEAATANQRTVYKYIHLEGIKSCQLVMGLTVLAPGAVWNSVPPHTHTRRMEVYFYFDVPEGQRVFHFMGQPQATRHLVLANHEAVISPPWSTHFGCGTANYGFIWGMAGENLDYTDMDAAPVASLL